MKPHVKIAFIQAINYVLTNGGDITEFKQYGYTECNTGVNVYYQRTTGKCFLFSDSIQTIYDSLEVWYERKKSNTKQVFKSTMAQSNSTGSYKTTTRLSNC